MWPNIIKSNKCQLCSSRKVHMVFIKLYINWGVVLQWNLICYHRVSWINRPFLKHFVKRIFSLESLISVGTRWKELACEYSFWSSLQPNSKLNETIFYISCDAHYLALVTSRLQNMGTPRWNLFQCYSLFDFLYISHLWKCVKNEPMIVHGDFSMSILKKMLSCHQLGHLCAMGCH